MLDALTVSLSLTANSSGALEAMQNYVTPTMQVLATLAGLISVFFIIYGGILYMSSTGRPDKLEQAKHVLKNAILGLVIVLAAGTLTAILNGAITHTAQPINATLPSLNAIEPATQSSGLIDILINAITGLLNTIIQTVASPFLEALGYFTEATPLMSENSSVFNFWSVMVGIADILFVIVVALIGFRVMSAAAFGFDEIEFKHVLPRLALAFLLLNISIFIIDGLIGFSNVLITAVGQIGGSSSVWDSLTSVVNESGGQGVAALLIMLVFLIFSFILLVYYVCRIVILYIGAVLSPLVILLWLVPGFKDFASTAMKTYVTTIFVLFIHVVVLQLSASLFVGMSMESGVETNIPNVLMAMVVGLSAVIILLKTQGLMMQFSYVSLGAKSTKQLGTQFMNGVSYLGGRGKAATSAVSGKVSSHNTTSTSRVKKSNVSSVRYTPAKTASPSSSSSSSRSHVSVNRVPARTSGSKPSSKDLATNSVSSRKNAGVKAIKKEDK